MDLAVNHLHVPKLTRQQKWFKNDDINVGDMVLFTKNDSVLSNSYTYGMIKSLDFSRDGIARKATIRYINQNEQKFRETKRAIRLLVIIHNVNNSDVMKELGEMALKVDLGKNLFVLGGV